MLSAMKEKCKSVYQPGCQLSVDEAMVPFKGRSSLKQYMPKKPIKRGFKVWVVSDARSGYFVDFNVYTGATGESPEHGLASQVVMTLTEEYQNQKRQVFCDNYFTSPQLFHALYQNGTYACGTVRLDRKGYPSELSSVAVGLERGHHVFRQCNSLVATIWKDTKDVKMLSTMTQPQATAPVNRKRHDGSTIQIPCPLCIVEYNKYMGGVDEGDQLRGYYRVRLKCRKNYKYIVFI